MDAHFHDAFWQEILGDQIPSQIQTGTHYRAERFLGGGGMSVALFATRFAPDGETPVVLKLLKPELARRQDQAALLAVTKEAVALGRLNDRVPTTPFVVRYIDSGNLRIMQEGLSLRLPWIAIEYVHGGREGTTVEQRVTKSIEQTSYAFDPERAALAVECLAQGLGAIHEVNVIHRDLKPANVLCSGFGEHEVFKIADFGIARPIGMFGTFGSVPVGTLGYASPEQLCLDALTPSSDIFGLAGVIYFLLTGEEYFNIEAVSDGVELAKKPSRRSITASRWLHPRLRAQPVVCAAIDVALANATAYDKNQRTSNASLLAQMIAPALRSVAATNRIESSTQRKVLGPNLSVGEGVVWTIRRQPDESCVVRAAAWDGAERCMMLTSNGLSFWDGLEARPVQGLGFDKPSDIHCVLRVDAGAWLVGGNGAMAVLCSSDGRSRIVCGPDPRVRFIMANGSLDGILIFVGQIEQEPPTLHACVAGYFLRPLPLERAAFVSSLSRVDATTWLVTGRTRDGDGFVMRYEPLQWEVRPLATPTCRAYLGSAISAGSSWGVVVGTNGRAARIEGEATTDVFVEGEPDLSAVAMDASQRIWLGSSGTLWVQKGRDESVRIAHRTPWEAPFVAIHADVDRVLAISASGGIVEGRLFQ